jgi:hypothetical protein
VWCGVVWCGVEGRNVCVCVCVCVAVWGLRVLKSSRWCGVEGRNEEWRVEEKG